VGCPFFLLSRRPRRSLAVVTMLTGNARSDRARDPCVVPLADGSYPNWTVLRSLLGCSGLGNCKAICVRAWIFRRRIDVCVVYSAVGYSPALPPGQECGMTQRFFSPLMTIYFHLEFALASSSPRIPGCQRGDHDDHL
jgi:hypothetical protein